MRRVVTVEWGLHVNNVVDILGMDADSILAVARALKFKMDLVADVMYKCPRRDMLGYLQEGSKANFIKVLKTIVTDAMKKEQLRPEQASGAAKGAASSRRARTKMPRLRNRAIQKEELAATQGIAPSQETLRRWYKIVEKDKYKCFLQTYNTLPEDQKEDYRESVVICQKNGSLDEFV